MDDLSLLIDLHLRAKRQGPGGDAETEKAIGLSGLDGKETLKIADIGCGSGASTLCLARHLNAHITAVDFLQDFLDVLEINARQAGLENQVDTLCGSMEDLPFAEQSLDVIWSEGAIYNMGFEKGLREWRRFLKPGGLLVVSEITWLSADRPSELEKHWHKEYPEINTASAKMHILEQEGYSPLAYFVLPQYCWLENYYGPMEQGFTGFLERNANSTAAQAIVDAERQEIELYKTYKDYYSYGVYIARKTPE